MEVGPDKELDLIMQEIAESHISYTTATLQEYKNAHANSMMSTARFHIRKLKTERDSALKRLEAQKTVSMLTFALSMLALILSGGLIILRIHGL